jgi:hypothetical protein
MQWVEDTAQICGAISPAKVEQLPRVNGLSAWHEVRGAQGAQRQACRAPSDGCVQAASPNTLPAAACRCCLLACASTRVRQQSLPESRASQQEGSLPPA